MTENIGQNTKLIVKRLPHPLITAVLVVSISHANAKTIVIEDQLPANLPAAPFANVAPTEPFGQLPALETDVLKKRIFELKKKQGAEQELLEAMTLLTGKTNPPSWCYDLASANARRGKIDAAIYWLQRAALEDECSAAAVEKNAAFREIVTDPRWGKMKTFLDETEKAWQQATYHRDVLTLPKGYNAATEIPLILGLHGYGSLPEDFSGDDHQKICDDLNVAFLSVSGSIPLGRNSFMWSAKFEDDWERICQAIKKTEPNIKVLPGKMVAIGFSQGGQLAGDLCAAYPLSFKGCIVMSPGSRSGNRLGDALKFGNNRAAGQHYFFSWISGEGGGPEIRSRDSKKMLEQAGAAVYLHEFPGKSHSFPDCYADYCSIALQVILKGR